MEISTILNQIDLGAMALPEFQRGYVWNRGQVRDSITELMQRGLGPYIGRIYQNDQLQADAATYIERLNRLHSIKAIHVHIEKVTGPDKNVDVVVEIFNKLNSGGTKLSKGDLALARICAEWTEARQELRSLLAKWKHAGFGFDMDWLLRNVNAVVTSKALFSALRDVPASDFQASLKQVDKAVDYLLNVIGGRLGRDHERVLGSRYAFPIMCRYLVQRGGKFQSAAERDKLLYWYVHSLLWGRYAGSTESTLMQDLTAMEQPGDAIERLIDQLRVWRGDLVVRPENFASWSVGARFYPMLYLLTRVGDARDWDTGLPLRAGLLGKTSRLEIHHIFPKAQLYRRGYGRPEVNALANYCFLTQATNLGISDTLPEIYFPAVESKYPGALASQWVPMDPQLWRIENYEAFLAERRRLLAEAANTFLNSLCNHGAAQGSTAPLPEPLPVVLDSVPVLGGINEEEEEIALLETNVWLTEQGLPEGEMLYELVNFETGAFRALLDLAWPNGIQTHYSDPVALLLNEEIETLELASAAGFRCFTDVASFRAYVEKEILAVDAIAAD